jgi:ferritin-like metal-binding protein YciE
MPSDSLETLHDLFVHELRDLYDAENQLIKALPLMAQAAQSPELKEAFETHLEETREQARRIEQVFQGLGEKASGKSCKAMQGLVAEAKELLEEDADPDVMDAALIVAAQKVEHYEIAGYGSVCTFGRLLGYNDATELLKETMSEEERTDKLLTGVAEKLNPEAGRADEADESEESGGASSGMGGDSGGRNRMAGGNRRGASGGGNRGGGRRSASSRSGGGRSSKSSRGRSGGGRGARSSSRSRRTTSSRR